MFKNSQKIAISKCLLIAALFIVVMFASFGVSVDDAYAADLNESADVIKSELNIEDKLENSQVNVLNTNEVEESILSANSNNDVLSATHSLNGGTFTDIRRAIINANSGDTIKLSGTFKAAESGGKIYLDKKITFTSDSQAVLDGKGISYIFSVDDSAAGSVFKNIKFVNGYRDGTGGAMYIAAKNIKISNCVFENNHATHGGAIYCAYDPTRAEKLVIENSRFYKNGAYRSAGAVGAYSNNSRIINCVFDSNYVEDHDDVVTYGGALQLGLDEYVTSAYAYNCKFYNNRAGTTLEKSHGGASCVRDGNVYENCIFINNTAAQGGALTYHASGVIKNCTFIDNHATYYGGALSTGYLYHSMNLNVDNCSFANNSAPIGGAAQLNGANIRLSNSNFDDNFASQDGGAINIGGKTVVIETSSFNRNIANVDGGAVFIIGNNTLIKDSSFRSNEAIPDASKLDDGLGGAIYINSTQATVENNEFYYNTARNGSAIYYDKSGKNLELANNVLFKNQAWVYALPIYAHDIYYTEVEKIRSVIHGGNNIADYDNLAVSNAIYNAAGNQNIVVNGETPVSGATTSGRLYQDDREYNIEILMTVVHEDGSVVYNNTLNSNCFGEVFDNLNNLKVGKYYVTARHFEDTYYKAITNTTTFNVISQVDNKVRKLVTDDEINYEDVVVWTLNITNNGPNNATNVVVTDVLPEGLIWLDDDTNGKYNPKTGILRLDFLAVGDVFIVNIITMVNKTGNIVNNVNITAKEYDYNLTNNFDEKTINVQPASDLIVVKAVNQSMPNYNDMVKWTITVANNGPDVAHDVKVNDVLPSSLIWISDTGAGNYNHNSGVWTVGTLNVGSSAKLEIVTRVKATGTIKNDASVSGREYDNNVSNNHDDEIINVKPSSDLAIAKLVNASVANFGDLVKWTLVVSNNGPDAATGVKVSDVLPRGFVYVSSSKPYSNGVINIGNLAVGQTQNVDIVCRVNVTGSFVNVATVTGNEYDYNLSNNRAERSILINPASDLAVVKAVNNTAPNFNDLVTWTVTVVNNGPDVAHEVKVNDVLPRSLIFVSSNGNYNKNSGIWDIGTLNVGASAALKIVSRVNSTGIIENVVSVSGREYDYDLSNNRDIRPIGVDPSSDLAIVKLVNVSVANFGDLVKWTLVVSNNGPDAATGVKVNDVLPRGFVYVSSSKPYSNGVINIGNLAVGQTQNVDIVSRVNVTGSFVNVATVTGNEYDYDLSNNRAERSILINPASDLSVVKVVNDTTPNFNDLVTWTVTVVNNGPDVAHEVKVSDVLPRSLIFVSSNGNYNKNSGIWDIGTLNVGASVALKIVSRVNSTGIIENKVSVSGREYDYDLSNNNDTQSIDVDPSSDLAIAKLVNVSVANFGDLVKWTLVVSNNGPDAATGVKVNDILPNGFVYVSSSKPYSNGIINIGNLAVGQTQSVDIVSRVNVTGTFVNVATVTGNEYDYDLSNNRAERSILINPASDLKVVKTVNDTTPNFNDLVTWTVTVVNNGPDVAHDVKVNDMLPSSLIWIRDTGSGNYNHNSGVWSIGTLNVGSSVSLNIVSRVNATGMTENKVSVSGREYDYDLSNNNDTQSIDVDPSSDLAIAKLVNVSVANFGDLVKWTLVVSNNGPDAATGVKVSDVLPRGFGYVSSSKPYSNGIINIGNLAVGQTQSVDIVSRVNVTGTFVNVASVSGNEYDHDLSNNRAERSILINPASDLSVVKAVNDTAPNFNDLVTWTITVVNNGPDVAHDVKVEDKLPESLIFISSNGNYNKNTGIWNIGTLNVGSTASLSIISRVNATGITENDVSVSGREYDYNKSNNVDSQSIDVANATDLSVIKLVNASIENYHELIKWTIIASNNGPDNATGVYVTDELPEGLVLINYTASKGFYDNGMWSICCMESGDSQTLEIVCYVNKTGKITNIATITGNEYDYDLSNNVANETAYIQNACDIEIIKTVNNTNPYFGEIIEWNITITNNGPDTANEIYAFDNLPKGLNYLNYVASKGVYDNDGLWYVQSLRNGESAYLLIRCEVNTLESVQNIVTVTPSEYDWNKSNNNDSEIIYPDPVADLSIVKLVNVSQANYLDFVEWTLIVTNEGPNDATGVFVSDVIVNGLQLISIEGDGEYDNSIWDVGDLNAGESKILQLVCKIVATGDFENSASVWGNEYDPDLSNNDAEESLFVPPASDLSITKTVSKYKYNVGDLVKYSIKVVNRGPDKATNVEVMEIMDDSLVLKSFKASYGDFDEITETWSIDELEVGDSASLNINAIAERPGIAKNNVSVTSDNYDPDLTDNEDSVDVNVTENPKKDDIPKNHHVTKSEKEISNPYQSILQKYISGNPLVMMLISVVSLLLIPCGISFSKKR